jgi:ABC-2 type transport system ATP-binding protein
VIVAAGLTKSFGGMRALDGFDLVVERGERVVMLGPNGAGKSTAISILLGLRSPDTGTVLVLGGKPGELAVRRRVGCAPQQTAFPETLRVREIVDFVRAHYPRPLPSGELLVRFRLAHLAARQVGGLSGGERRRLGCALAFAGNPEVVVLDEPSAGLDVEARLALWETLRAHAGTILMTTHSFEEADALATRIVVVNRGRTAETTARGPGLADAYLALTS